MENEENKIIKTTMQEEEVSEIKDAVSAGEEPAKSEDQVVTSEVRPDEDKESLNSEPDKVAALEPEVTSALKDEAQSENLSRVTGEAVSNVNEKSEESVSEDEPSMQVGIAESDNDASDDSSDIPVSEDTDDDEEEQEEGLDYSTMEKEELIAHLVTVLDSPDVYRKKNRVENMRISFYKKVKQDAENRKKAFLLEGGNIEEYQPQPDALEPEFKKLYNDFKEVRSAYLLNIEDRKKENLKLKLEVIEGIKELINGTESLNATFQDFRNLQDKWRTIGPVPQADVKDLYDNYHYNVEKFYDYVKINKELRDLDLKKNLEAKIEICERAEELIIEPNIRKAFKELQKLHDAWRETGPVQPEQKESIWMRFKDATTIINKKHQEFFLEMKEELEKNLEAKKFICDRIEEIAAIEINTHKEWTKHTAELLELQKMWKTIGFAPKKENNAVYERFRNACDSFFDAKKEFYSQAREEQSVNVQLKTDLCIQAEELSTSRDWKQTTSDIIALQDKWKKIGPVPHKKSEMLWKRFRSACDTFFKNKSEFFATIDTVYEENLAAKKALIEKVEAFEPSADAKADMEALKAFQREWTEIGHVPAKQKGEIQDRFRNAINSRYDKLNVNEKEKTILKFKTRIGSINQDKDTQRKIGDEREKLLFKLKKLEEDQNVLENNIGFFSKSKNAEGLIKEVQKKIDRNKEEIAVLKEKISLIDKMT